MAILKEAKKQIIGANFYVKDWKTFYRVEYVDFAKTWDTWIDKEWKERDKLERVIKFVIVDFDKLKEDKNFVWKSEKEICQVMVWKSLVISTKLE